MNIGSVLMVTVLTWISGFFMGVGITNLIYSSVIHEDGGYKQGQIDAINGKICYQIVLQADGSTKWEKIEK